MSISRRQKKKTQSQIRLPADQKSVRRFLSPLCVTLFCLLPAVFFFVFGKILEFSQPDPFDSGAYVYSARHLLEGARLGIEEIPSAQPGTLLVNIIGVYFFGFSEIGPKIIQMIMQIAALTAMFFASRKLLGKTAAVLSVTVASIYLSAPHIAKFGNVKEQYMIAWMVLAISFWIFYELTEKKRWLLLTGAALIWPYYFKATGLTVDIAFALYFLGRAARVQISLKQFQKELLLLISGAIFGLIPLFLFFLWQQQPHVLFNSLPILILKAIVAMNLLGFGLVVLGKLHLFTRLCRWSRQVRPAIWIVGGLSMIILLASAAIRIYAEEGDLDDVRSYLSNLFFIRIGSNLVLKLNAFYQTLLQAAGTDSIYVSLSRQTYTLSRQAPIVLRYYASLSVPLALAMLSALSATGVTLYKRLHKRLLHPQDRLAWLLLSWWLLDMTFVWISPRSYEQYYLPPCASGAILGGYAVWLYVCLLKRSDLNFLYLFGAVAAGAVMIAMAWPIVFGLRKSTFSGQEYINPQTQKAERRRGYVQALAQVRNEPGPWQKIGRHIRRHSEETDRIYVWGWYPGIYIEARRLAPIPRAFDSDMHVRSPRALASQIDSMVRQFEKTPPAFIVDSRKQHFPWNRPPLELWPILRTQQNGRPQSGFAPADPAILERYETSYKAALEKQIGPEEARRFEAMKPLRDYVMTHYRIVPDLSWPKSPHVLFEQK